MATSEWESYVLCSRLKTKRQKNRLRIKDSDKQLLRLHKQLKRIRYEEHQLGYNELDPPVQRGWKRSFVLGSDVAQSNDSAFFQSLLDKINTKQFSHRKDFKNKKKTKRKKGAYRAGSKIRGAFRTCV